MLRRVRIPSCLASSSRSYAISVNQPVVYAGKVEPRTFAVRKTYLYNQYTSLLNSSPSSPLLFLQHKNFRAGALIKLRRDIAAAATRHVPSLSGNGGVDPLPALPQLTVIHTPIFGVALRSFAPLDAKTTQEIAKLVEGGLAILSFPSLNPPQLQAIVRALERAVPPKKAKTEEEVAKEKEAADADTPTPGRRPKRIRPMHVPELTLLGALIEGRVFKAEGVKDVATLPTLDTLRMQIVGLLSSPATQLAAVLSEASGGKLARTLEGLKKGLEDGQAAPNDTL